MVSGICTVSCKLSKCTLNDHSYSDLRHDLVIEILLLIFKFWVQILDCSGGWIFDGMFPVFVEGSSFHMCTQVLKKITPVNVSVWLCISKRALSHPP